MNNMGIEGIIIILLFVWLTWFLSKPQPDVEKPKKKAKKFGDGLLTDIDTTINITHFPSI